MTDPLEPRIVSLGFAELEGILPCEKVPNGSQSISGYDVPDAMSLERWRRFRIVRFLYRPWQPDDARLGLAEDVPLWRSLSTGRVTEAWCREAGSILDGQALQRHAEAMRIFDAAVGGNVGRRFHLLLVGRILERLGLGHWGG